jgi:hypothetical protein
MSHEVAREPQFMGRFHVNEYGMHLGQRFRRVAAAMVLTLGLGLFAGDGAALGLELPSVDPALGETTSPVTSALPSTRSLPVDPQAIAPAVTPNAVSSITPAPAGPSGPSGPSVTPSNSYTGAGASISRLRRRNLGSIGRARNLVNGDRSSVADASGSKASVLRRARASGRHRTARQHRAAPKANPFQAFQPSQFQRLGRIIGRHGTSTPFLGGFSASATGTANWAPPLLMIMLLIGLGGFVRLAKPASRRHP